MTTTAYTKPIDTIRDGSLKVTIWKNSGEKGDYYTARLTRTWSDEHGEYHDSDTFSGSELMRIARLANIAYDEIAVHRKRDREQRA